MAWDSVGPILEIEASQPWAEEEQSNQRTLIGGERSCGFSTLGRVDFRHTFEFARELQQTTSSRGEMSTTHWRNTGRRRRKKRGEG